MSDQQLGFDWDEQPQESAHAPQLPLAAKLADRLGGLARRGIFLGTSSWKYPGWRGQVYEPARYQARGRFSQKKFARNWN